LIRRPQIGTNLVRIAGLRLQETQDRIRELSTQPTTLGALAQAD